MVCQAGMQAVCLKVICLTLMWLAGKETWEIRVNLGIWLEIGYCFRDFYKRKETWLTVDDISRAFQRLVMKLVCKL